MDVFCRPAGAWPYFFNVYSKSGVIRFGQYRLGQVRSGLVFFGTIDSYNIHKNALFICISLNAYFKFKFKCFKTYLSMCYLIMRRKGYFSGYYKNVCM